MVQRSVGQRSDRELRELATQESIWSKGGRPPIELPPEVARAILDDLAAGATLAKTVGKYQPVVQFSYWWLVRAMRDGRIERMARADVGRSPGNGPPARP